MIFSPDKFQFFNQQLSTEFFLALENFCCFDLNLEKFDHFCEAIEVYKLPIWLILNN